MEMLVGKCPDDQLVRHPVVPAMTVNDKNVAHQLARKGHGAAPLIGSTVEQDLADGTLVDLEPDVDFGVVSVQALLRDPQPSPAAPAFLRVATEAPA